MKSGGIKFVVNFASLIAGIAVLVIANISMNPVPVSAAPAFGVGAVGFFLLRNDTARLVITLAVVGAAIGLVIHRDWHMTGRSPAPETGILEHLAIEGLIGLFVGLLALAASGLIIRFFEERTSR